jgi:hypothetical protein
MPERSCPGHRPGPGDDRQRTAGLVPAGRRTACAAARTVYWRMRAPPWWTTLAGLRFPIEEDHDYDRCPCSRRRADPGWALRRLPIAHPDGRPARPDDGRGMRASRRSAGPDRGHSGGLCQRGARGDGRHRALGCAGGRLPGLGPCGDRQPVLRVVPDVRDPDRACDSLGRARRGPGGWGRVDVAVGLGVDKGRRAVHAAGTGADARHDVGRRRRPPEPGAARQRRVHRHDADRAECRRPLRPVP